MAWFAIIFVITVIAMMVVVGYYLIRSYLNGYTYYVPSKT
jgi:L-asparagine transporter-like permease